MLCYLDTNIFLNVIYNEPRYAKGSGQLLKNIQNGRLTAMTSSITGMEIALDLGKTGNRLEIDEALGLIERMSNLSILPLNLWTVRIAARLALDLDLTVHDAYHAATALEHGAQSFITRDKLLGKMLKEKMKVSEPEALL